MRADVLALPLLLLAPFAAAGSSNHKPGKRTHRRLEKTPEQARDLEITQFNHNSTLTKRQTFNGRGTFYYTGLGACGQYSKDSDYMVALNSAQYCCGYPGPQCFKTITVQANGVTVGGVQIMDECPTCDYGGLDLSPGLFKRFADEGAGVIQVSWWFEGSNPQPAPSTTTTHWVEPTTTWTPPSSTWSPPSSTWSPTTTWTPPSSTSVWVAPSSSSTTTQPPPPSSSSSSTTLSSSTVSVNATLNPFAVIASVNSTSSASASVSLSATDSAAASASASASSSTGAGGAPVVLQVQGHNLEALNGLVTNYGQLIVVGASGKS